MKAQLLSELCQALREIDIEPKTIDIALFHSCTEEEINRFIRFCHWINTLEEFEKNIYSMILKVTMMLADKKEMKSLLNDFDPTVINFHSKNEKIREKRRGK